MRPLHDEEGMRARKRWLLEQITLARQRYEREIEPFIKELSDIAFCEPPAPVPMPDGRVLHYVGPLASWNGGKVIAP